MLALLWGGVAREETLDRAAWHTRAMSEIHAQAYYFADSLHNKINQLDQLSTRQVREKQAGLDSKIQLRQFHLVHDSTPVYPFNIDADGVVRSASLQQALGQDFASYAFFNFHKNNASEEMHINSGFTVLELPDSAKAVLFTRRVSKFDGSFDGVAVIAAAASNLYQAGSHPNINSGMMKSVWLVAGEVVAENIIKPEDGLLAQYHKRPVFTSVAGTTLEPGQKFLDKYSRYLSWKQLDDYPVIALVSIAENASLAMYGSISHAHYMTGLTCTILLLLSGLIGARLQIKRDAQLLSSKEIEASFRLAINGAQESFYLLLPAVNPDGGESFSIADCNDHAAQSIGRSRKDMLGKTIVDVFSEAEAGKIHQILQSSLKDGFCEASFHAANEKNRSSDWLHYRAISSGRGIAVTVRDVTELKNKEEQLNAMAMTDALTLLPNRHWLNHFLPAALDNARANKSNLALLFIDLDDFKKINDTLGHQVGDEFLLAVAGALRSAVRKNDRVVRLGGDEFMVLLEDVSMRADVTMIARQILDKLGSLKINTGISASAVSASIGVAFFPDDAVDAAALIQAADMAMYIAKSEGKGQFALYSTDIASRILLKNQMQQALQQAINHDELLLYYQPRACARTGKLLYLEALLRWQHPQRGMVSPAEFISLAEESALIHEIGNWVVENVCAHLAGWRQQGLPDIPVSMNISAQQLKTDQFRLQLDASMATHGIVPGDLAIELTEATMAENDPLIREELWSLHKMGIELHIDDFGTGYSSLSLLQQMQIDVIKIDKSFIQAIGIHAQGHTICEAMVQIGKTMGFRVVAEGVETQAQLLELQHMRCDEIQGYLISPPVTSEKVPALLSKKIFLQPLFPVVQRIVEKA